MGPGASAASYIIVTNCQEQTPDRNLSYNQHGAVFCMQHRLEIQQATGGTLCKAVPARLTQLGSCPEPPPVGPGVFIQSSHLLHAVFFLVNLLPCVCTG